MSKKTILIVDDAEIIRKQIREILLPLGYEVIEADDGISGIKAFEAHPETNLIISDINMPNMDGLTMCENLKKKEGFNLPILMLTTEASRSMKEEGKRIGVKGWMLKPFDANNLLAAIDLLLKQK